MWQDTKDFHFNLQKSDTAAPWMLWFQAAFSQWSFTWNHHLKLGKPYKQWGRINKILIKISLLCHPSIRLWLEFSGKKLNSADVHALAASPLSFHVVNTLLLPLLRSKPHRSPPLWLSFPCGSSTFTYDLQRHGKHILYINSLWACNKLIAVFGSVYAPHSRFNLDTSHAFRQQNIPHTLEHKRTHTSPPPPAHTNKNIYMKQKHNLCIFTGHI